MKRDIFLMILNSKKHEGQVPELELALLFQISLLLYSEFLLVFAPHALKGRTASRSFWAFSPYLKAWVMNS